MHVRVVRLRNFRFSDHFHHHACVIHEAVELLNARSCLGPSGRSHLSDASQKMREVHGLDEGKLGFRSDNQNTPHIVLVHLPAGPDQPPSRSQERACKRALLPLERMQMNLDRR